MTWGLVDASAAATTGISLSQRVLGLPFLARTARMAARAGWAGLRVVVPDGAAEEACRAALTRFPPPVPLAVEYQRGEAEPSAGRAYVPVEVFGVYSVAELKAAAAEQRSPRSAVAVHSRADLPAVRAELMRSIRKSIAQDGLIAYYTQRPLARVFTRVLIDTPVTANQVTLAAMACGLAAAVCAGIGGAGPIIAAGFLYWFGAVVDCVDGDLARLRVKGSKLGEWLDTLADDLSTFGLVAGLGIGLARDGYDAGWAYLGVAAAVVGALGNAKLYWDLHRMGSIIDSAYYPWFFGSAADAAKSEEPKGLVGTIFSGFSYLFRRDAYVTIVGILLVFQARRAALILLVAGIAIIVVLLVVHLVVTRLRGSTRG